MIGTIINAAAIIIGSFAGVLVGKKLSDDTQKGVLTVIGLFAVGLGIQMFLKTGNPVVVLLSLLIGMLIGKALKIESGLAHLGDGLRRLVAPGNGDEASKNRFIQGFVVASLMFCIGPMAILGSIQSGLTGDIQTLVIKSIMDGFTSFAFASTLGIGVSFSAIPVFILQGGLTLLAAYVNRFLTVQMVNELTATGGILILSLSISTLLEIKKIKTGNLLPALILAPILVALFAMLGL